MTSLEALEKEIEELKKRNLRVEADKAWETSTARKCAILVLTYGVMVVFFAGAKIERPFVNALVPVLAFALSTLTLSLFKKWWMNKKNLK
ncbi:MAG: hypothetical protein Q8P56_06520 [Candidatus Uhrbacteria bacterium]|nr:hypothetical protein [Candidatus Uhrbacteria bacterium]